MWLKTETIHISLALVVVVVVAVVSAVITIVVVFLKNRKCANIVTACTLSAPCQSSASRGV